MTCVSEPLFRYIDELLDVATLSCEHTVSFDQSTAPLTKEGWPRAVYCPSCRRPREVTRIAYRRPRDP